MARHNCVSKEVLKSNDYTKVIYKGGMSAGIVHELVKPKNVKRCTCDMRISNWD